MQTILENYFEQQQLQTDCHVQNDGKTISVTYRLGEGEWASNYIVFDQEKMTISVSNSMGNSTWDLVKRFQQGVPESMEKIFSQMVQFWGFLLQHCPEIELVLIKAETDKFGKKAFEFLKNSGFVSLNQAHRDFVKGHYGYEINWLGRVGTEDDITKTLILAVAIASQLQEKNQHDPTVEIEWVFKTHTIKICYRGLDVAINTSVLNHTLILTFDKQEYVIANEQEAKNAIDAIFATLEENQTPSKKHYEAYLKEIHIRTSYVERIYEKLLTHYTWLEIEAFAAKRRHAIDAAKKATLYEEETKLLRYLQHFFVLDYETKEMSVYNEKDSAIQVFKTQIFKKQQQKIEEEIKHFLYDTNQPD